MAAVSTMLLRSLRLIGEKTPGGTLTTDEGTAYLADFNTFLDGCSIDRMMIPSLLQESLALTTGTESYTIGSGGAFNTTRPTRICDPCFTRNSDNSDWPLTIIDAEVYGGITQKDTGNAVPQYLFYDGTLVAGLGTINLFPPPSASLTLYINSWKQFVSAAHLSTDVTLQPGYRRFIEFNFAVEVAGGFTNVSAEVAKIAKESKAIMKGFNAPAGIMGMPAGVAGRTRVNILTGV